MLDRVPIITAGYIIAKLKRSSRRDFIALGTGCRRVQSELTFCSPPARGFQPSSAATCLCSLALPATSQYVQTAVTSTSAPDAHLGQDSSGAADINTAVRSPGQSFDARALGKPISRSPPLHLNSTLLLLPPSALPVWTTNSRRVICHMPSKVSSRRNSNHRRNRPSSLSLASDLSVASLRLKASRPTRRRKQAIQRCRRCRTSRMAAMRTSAQCPTTSQVASRILRRRRIRR